MIDWRICVLSPWRVSFEYRKPWHGRVARLLWWLRGYEVRAVGWNIDYPRVLTFQKRGWTQPAEWE